MVIIIVQHRVLVSITAAACSSSTSSTRVVPSQQLLNWHISLGLQGIDLLLRVEPLLRRLAAFWLAGLSVFIMAGGFAG